MVCRCLEDLKNYLSEEHLERKQIALQMDGWKTITKTEEVIIIRYKIVICHIQKERMM